MKKLLNILAVTALCGAGILPVSCREEIARVVDPIAHEEPYDIWPDSIDLHNGVILRVVSDSVMQVRVGGNILDSVVAPALPEERMTFSSDLPLLDFLYRLEASSAPSGRYTAQTPYEIYLNPLQNDSARQALESRLRNGLVVPAEVRGLGWPVVNSNAEWLLGASELAVASGDGRWLREVRQTARSVLEADLRVSYDPGCGLFTGIPRYIAAGAGMLPPWMNVSDLSGLVTFGVNAAYCGALRTLESADPAPGGASDPGHRRWSISVSSDSLLRSLKKEMWLPNRGYFSALNYGPLPYRIPLQATDNLAQAFAVLTGTASGALADAMIAKTPAGYLGMTLFQPQLPPASGPIRNEISPMLLQTAWTIACARRANEAAYSFAVGALIAAEGERLTGSRHRLPSFRSTFTSLIVRGLLGVRYNPDCMEFSPYVPENLPGEKRISNLRYRNARLDIRLSGTGHAISTFTIDGRPSEPFFPADMEGDHQIVITLAGAASDPGSANRLENPRLLPLPAECNWNQRSATLAPGRLPAGITAEAVEETFGAEIPSDREDCFLVYVDGTLEEEIFRTDYQLFDAKKPVAIQFCPLSGSQYEGFSAPPYLYVPSRSRHMIYTPSIARNGTKVLEDKKIAERFVESTRFRNRRITFGFDAPKKGRYLIDLRYACGLGIVNAQRRVALRQLRVNNLDAGVFVFIQLTPAALRRMGEPVESWQTAAAWTNPLEVELHEGHNDLELRYYQPSPVYVDPQSNTVLTDIIRIISID